MSHMSERPILVNSTFIWTSNMGDCPVWVNVTYWSQIGEPPIWVNLLYWWTCHMGKCPYGWACHIGEGPFWLTLNICKCPHGGKYIGEFLIGWCHMQKLCLMSVCFRAVASTTALCVAEGKSNTHNLCLKTQYPLDYC